jgi:hypothetical protein
MEDEILNEIEEVERSMKDLYAKEKISEKPIYNESKRLIGNLRVFLGVRNEN